MGRFGRRIESLAGAAPQSGTIRMGKMRISAKVDYAVRAGIELATAEDGKAIKGDLISERQDIPVKFLENILGEMKHHGLIASRRGAEGGYWLAKPADQITIADVIRAV